MIPKIIHYCWLSNDPIPEDLQRYMESWKQYLPDYEFIKWDFNRFEKSSSIWVSEAFDNRKYAFAADYIRLYALYNYGGIYLDMDVEVLKPYTDRMLTLRTMICWERDGSGLEVAAFGVEKNSPWIKTCLNYYEGRHFVNEDGSYNTTVLPQLIKNNLIENQYKLISVKNVNEASGVNTDMKIPVFPCDYFSPKSYLTGKINVTNNTFSIHHFAGSWLVGRNQYKHNLRKKLSFLPGKLGMSISSLITIIKYDSFAEGLKHFLKRIRIRIKNS